jgi:hypothetical protein
MAGMHCDSCEGLFEYNEQLIALREEDGELVPVYTIEQEGGSIGETFQPIRKYHVRCYETMREQQPEDWPELNPTS